MTENQTDNSEKRERIVIWIIATFFELALLYAWLMGKLNGNKDNRWLVYILVIATASGSLLFAATTELLHKQWTTWKIIIVNTILAAIPCLSGYGLAYATKDIGWLFMGIAFLGTPLAVIVPINTIISRIHYLYCRKNKKE